jgi:hypothetical protein
MDIWSLWAVKLFRQNTLADCTGSILGCENTSDTSCVPQGRKGCPTGGRTESRGSAELGSTG